MPSHIIERAPMTMRRVCLVAARLCSCMLAARTPQVNRSPLNLSDGATSCVNGRGRNPKRHARRLRVSETKRMLGSICPPTSLPSTWP